MFRRNWCRLVTKVALVVGISSGIVFCQDFERAVGIEENPGKIGEISWLLKLTPSVFVQLDEKIMEWVSDLAELSDEFGKIKEAKNKDDAVSLDTFSAFVHGGKLLKELGERDYSLNLYGNLLYLSIPFNAGGGRWAIAVEPQWMASSLCDIDSVNLGFGSSINLGTLLSGYQVATTTPAGLESYAQKLSDALESLAYYLERVGIHFGGYTATDIANALINAALSPPANVAWGTLTYEQIKDAIDKIVEGTDELKTLLKSVSSENSIDRNQTALKIAGIAAPRLSLIYQTKLKRFENLSVGGALRIYPAYLFYDEVKIIEGEKKFDLSKNVKFSVGIGVDAGLSYTKTFLKEKIKTQLGLSLQNLVCPKFKVPQGAQRRGISYLKLPRRIILDSAIILFHDRLRLGALSDLAKFKPLLGGAQRQECMLSLELAPFSSKLFGLAVSAQALRDITCKSNWLVIGGLKLRLWRLSLESSGGWSKPLKFLEGKLPPQGVVQVGIGMQF